MALRVILIAGITATCVISGGHALGADLVGRVLNSHGEAVSGVTVSVRNSSGVAAGKAVSDANGAYAISNLKPGTYTLTSSEQSVMSYIGSLGLTVDWGIAPHAPPVAVARLGTTEDTAKDTMKTGAVPSKISNHQSKPGR